MNGNHVYYKEDYKGVRVSMESNKDRKGYQEEDANGQEEFSFLQETIKREPVTGKMIAKQLGKMAICGIVFGLMAGLSFFALKPWAETTFQKNPDKVTIPKDKEEDTEDEEEQQDEVVMTPELTLDSYRQMTAQLYEVAREAGKSIVEIKGIHGNEGWIRESYDMANSVSGAIIADTGAELLMLASNSVLQDSESITVTFDDGNTYIAKLKKQDKNLGIAIFSVMKADLKSGTLDHVKPAKLGNSNLVTRGNVLIALGKPFGYSDGLGYGVASSVRKTISLADGDYRLLLSDIPESDNGSGFLLNIQGEIVGIIKREITNDESLCVSNALAISDLKESIELLSNGKSVPYVGITGTEVTEVIEKEQGIPRGVYVKNVESDSPAMEAGIQCGDIITGVEKAKITTLNAYQNGILKYEAGEQIKLSGQRRSNSGYVELEFTVTVGSRE